MKGFRFRLRPLDGPSAADRQPSPGAEMIDRGNKSSQAVLNKCHLLLLLNQKTTSMYLPKVDSSPGSCSRSLQCIFPSYRPRVDSTIDLDGPFSSNLARETFSNSSTTPHTKSELLGICAEDGRISLRQPPRRIRNRGTDEHPHLTTWRVE